MSLIGLYVVFSSVLAASYVVIMWQYIRAWQELKIWKLPRRFNPSTRVSILIPARNEAENILACLHSIQAQSYPIDLWEVILLDDHSTDKTADLARSLAAPNIRVLALADYINKKKTQSFKKKALEVGIAHATGDLIVTTDADCIVQPDWLALLVSFYEKKGYKFIAAPVNFHQEQNALERFQSLDFMGMMCVAGAGIQGKFMRMCNGANLAYEKAVFEELNGFEGIDQLASGDDMLFMQKVAAHYPTKIGYLKNQAATTFTRAKPTIKSFLNQRIRWSTKSNSYQESLVTLILALVFFFCCNIVLSLFLIPFFGTTSLVVFLGSLFIKAAMDYPFLSQMAHFFKRKTLIRSFIPSFFLHITYIVVVGILANFVRKYEWKGRRVQ